MKGEASESKRIVKIELGLLFVSLFCTVFVIAWLILPIYDSKIVILIGIIGLSSLIIAGCIRHFNIEKDISNIESVNDPNTGINDE